MNRIGGWIYARMKFRLNGYKKFGVAVHLISSIQLQLLVINTCLQCVTFLKLGKVFSTDKWKGQTLQ